MMKMVLVLAIALASACSSELNAKPPAKATLADLTVSLDAFRAEFNAHKAEPRFVTLLSAT